MFQDTRYFTVFGNAYVPERHTKNDRFGIDPKARQQQTAAAS